MVVPSGAVTERPSISTVTVATAVAGSCTAVIRASSQIPALRPSALPAVCSSAEQQRGPGGRVGEAVGVQAAGGVVARHHGPQALGGQGGDPTGAQLQR